MKIQKIFHFPFSIFSRSRERGAGFLEMILTVAVLGIIFVISVFGLLNFRATMSMNGAQDRILTAVRTARSKTIASEGLSVYGVHFDADQVVVFYGATYVMGDTRNVVYAMPSGVSVSNVDMTTWPDVTFARITGRAQGTGRVRISMAGVTSETREISLRDQTELAGTTSLPAQAGTRITDTRHVHFNLGWSMQSATDLILTFTTNSGIQAQTISMAPYFSGGPPATSFDWSGSFVVDGKTQTLRIHTHLLDGTNTTLSVHRNRMENTKPLLIAVSSVILGVRPIVSYASTGTMTVQAFGGTATVQ